MTAVVIPRPCPPRSFRGGFSSQARAVRAVRLARGAARPGTRRRGCPACQLTGESRGVDRVGMTMGVCEAIGSPAAWSKLGRDRPGQAGSFVDARTERMVESARVGKESLCTAGWFW